MRYDTGEQPAEYNVKSKVSERVNPAQAIVV